MADQHGKIKVGDRVKINGTVEEIRPNGTCIVRVHCGDPYGTSRVSAQVETLEIEGDAPPPQEPGGGPG